MALNDYWRIVRKFESGQRRIVNPRCTEAEAKAHCNDKEASSRTCTSKEGKARTRRAGSWFDAWEKVEGKK